MGRTAHPTVVIRIPRMIGRGGLIGSAIASVALAAAALALGGCLPSGAATAQARNKAEAAGQGAYAGLERRWWDPDQPPNVVGMPRIRPVNCGNGEGGDYNGLANDRLRKSCLWPGAQMLNDMYWQYRLTASASVRQKIELEWRYLQALYTPAQLASDGSRDGTVCASDDAAWKALALEEIHETTGDARALDDLQRMIPAVLARFYDPSVPRVANRTGEWDLSYSPYGLIYAPYSHEAVCASGQVGVSTSYEAGLALAAVYVYEKTRVPAFLRYAQATYGWMHSRLRHPAGYYETELDIKPRQLFNATGALTKLGAPAPAGARRLSLTGVPSGIASETPIVTQLTDGDWQNGVAHLHGNDAEISPPLSAPAAAGAQISLWNTPLRNADYLKAVGLGGSSNVGNDGQVWGPPRRGLSASCSGCTLGVATLAAELYRATGDRAYLEAVRDIAASFTRPDAFGRPGDLIVNERDPYTEGYFYPWFASRGLGLAGVDRSGDFRRHLAATAAYIMTHCQTQGGYFTADWSGPESDGQHETWQASYETAPGFQAGARQIMTDASTVAVVLAEQIVSRQGSHR